MVNLAHEMMRLTKWVARGNDVRRFEAEITIALQPEVLSCASPRRSAQFRYGKDCGALSRRGRTLPQGGGAHGNAYGYQNDGYAATGDLSFRCNVDYRGAVTNVRINRANTYRG